MARIPLPTRETLDGEALQQRWDRLESRGPVLNVFRMFLLNPEVELNARRLWDATGLTPRAREVVILRSAYVKQSTYEWHQHVRIALGEGLTTDEINAIRDWRDSTAFSEDERALLAYVDELATNARPSDETFAAVSRGRSLGEVFGVTWLITQYFQLAHVMAALDLETEGPFVGWEIQG